VVANISIKNHRRPKEKLKSMVGAILKIASTIENMNTIISWIINKVQGYTKFCSRVGNARHQEIRGLLLE
jgi:hypothetical protein